MKNILCKINAKNCEKGDFLVKTVRYIYFLEI